MPLDPLMLPRWLRSAIAAAFLVPGFCAAPHLTAQASPYLARDDPRYPLLEYLIQRGDIDDPSPFVRPVTQAQFSRALAASTADSASTPGRVVAAMRADLADPGSPLWYRVDPRAGLDAFTHARRDLLHPGGEGGVRPYLEAGLTASLGPIVLVARPAAENRLKLDPDWKPDSIQYTKSTAYRVVEGYGSAQWKWGNVYFGSFDQNWGITGVDGIAISDYAYPRTTFGLEAGSRWLRFSSNLSPLRDTTDTNGTTVHRYFMAHRLDVRVSKRVDLALWETSMVAATGDANVPLTLLNPFRLWTFTDQFGEGAVRNTIVGLDARGRVSRTVLLEGQFGIDDWSPSGAGDIYPPQRFMVNAAVSVALRNGLLLRGLYSVVSSLAYSTFNPSEDFTEQGVGLARGYPDNEQFTVLGAFPWRGRWLLSPQVTYFLQGEGRINDPLPDDSTFFHETPTLFIGTVEKTLRLAVGVSGVSGPRGILAVAGIGGLHQVWNADHVPGRTATRFEGRIRVTVGYRLQGRIKE